MRWESKDRFSDFQDAFLFVLVIVIALCFSVPPCLRGEKPFQPRRHGEGEENQGRDYDNDYDDDYDYDYDNDYDYDYD
jgi:hypothetical protein